MKTTKTTPSALQFKRSQLCPRNPGMRLALIGMVCAWALACLQGARAQVALTLITDARSVQTGDGTTVSAGFGQAFDAALNIPDYYYDQHAADTHATQFSTISSAKITGNGSASIDHISDPARSSNAKSTLALAFALARPGWYKFTASCTGGHTRDYAQLRTSTGKVLAKASLDGNAAASGTLGTGNYHLEAECYAKDVTGWYSGSWRFDLTFAPSVGSLTIHPVGSSNTVTLTCLGEPGTRCSMQKARSPNGPWATVDTIAVPSVGDGSFSLEDTNVLAPAAFYRLLQQ